MPNSKVPLQRHSSLDENVSSNLVPFHLRKLLPRIIPTKDMGQLRLVGRTVPVQGSNRIGEILRDLAEDVHLQLGPKDAEVPEKHITYTFLPYP